MAGARARDALRRSVGAFTVTALLGAAGAVGAGLTWPGSAALSARPLASAVPSSAPSQSTLAHPAPRQPAPSCRPQRTSPTPTCSACLAAPLPRLPSARAPRLAWMRGQPTAGRDVAVPPPARRQPGRLVGVGTGRVRRGARAQRAGAAERRVRRLPLVPRDGARVVRGRRDRGVHERALRQHQGRPGGATRRRRRLHAGDDRDDRARRLADDRRPRPRRRPFFAGTYFPDRPRHGQPAFTQVLQALADGVAGARRRGTTRRRQPARAPRPVRPAAVGSRDRRALDGAVRSLAEEFDPMAGGFGDAPKFPPTMVLEFLSAPQRLGRPRGSAAHAGPHELRRWQAAGCTTSSVAGSRATPSIAAGWCPTSRRCCTTTRSWSVSTPVSAPRRATGSPARPPTSFSASCAHPRAGSRPRSMPTAPTRQRARASRAPSTPGRRRSCAEALGDDHGPWAADLFAVTEAGTFEHGMSTLQLRHYPSDDLDRTRLAHVKARLLAVRDERPRPGRDDKVVAAWNGLVISGLCDAGLLLGEQEYVDAAVAAGELLARLHVIDGVDPARLPGRRGRAARGSAGGLRLRRVGLPVPRAGDRRRAVAHPRDRSARPRARRLRRSGRRLLRHPHRRRGAGRQAAGPGGQRLAERVQQHGPRPA